MHSELAREKMWARIHLIPALQAEEDRDQVRRYLADKAREKELLGTETRVYNSDRYVPEIMHSVRSYLLIRVAGLSDQPSLSRLRTRQSRGGLTIEEKRHCGWNCTYSSQRGVKVEVAPLVAVSHRGMHNNRIYVFFGFHKIFSVLHFMWTARQIE